MDSNSSQLLTPEELKELTDAYVPWYKLNERLDPRVKLITVLSANALLLISSSYLVFLSMLGLALVLLLTGGYFRSLVRGSVCTAGFLALWGLSLLFPASVVMASFGYMAFWLARFSVAYMIGSWFVHSTSQSMLLAGLSKWRVPTGALIPLAVLIRFVPVVLTEFRAVYEAMKIRQLTGWGALAHPLRTFSRFVVPTLAALSRLGDELSAAALTRGLGYSTQITQLRRLHFTWPDYKMLVYLLLCLALALWEA